MLAMVKDKLAIIIPYSASFSRGVWQQSLFYFRSCFAVEAINVPWGPIRLHFSMFNTRGWQRSLYEYNANTYKGGDTMTEYIKNLLDEEKDEDEDEDKDEDEE